MNDLFKLAQTEGRRATEALEREAIMARKLASLELELKAERAGSAATQAHLLEADEGLNEREAAWEAQRQILVDDADRLREQMYEFKRERDDLKIKSEALKDDGVIGRSKDTELSSSVTQMADVLAERKAYEAEVSELTLSISAMRDEMKLKDETMIKLQTSMQATIESLDNERTFLAEKVRTLETEISEAPSKESINSMRRELRILKKLEYNASDPEAEKETQEMIQSSANGDVNDLESVLMNKLRKVESDLVKERREKTNHLKQCEKLKQELEKNQKAKAESDALAARLEADLDKATAAPAPSMKTNGDIPIQTKSDPSTLEHILDPNMPEPVVTQATAVPVESFSAVEKINDDHSVATIVMAQRDRLRARCDALEAERDSFKRELQVQVSTTESLKSDNTKLYEKVRYLQSYNNSVGVHARTTASLADRDLDLEALEQRYEASVDPFRQFSRAERQRKVKEMSPMERTVFFVARTVLGSKEMRTVLFFYVLGMHLLVFFTTYHWSHGCTSVAHPDHIEEMHKGLPQME
jgi:homeobox protein cut-like